MKRTGLCVKCKVLHLHETIVYSGRFRTSPDLSSIDPKSYVEGQQMVITTFKSAPTDASRGIFCSVYGLLWKIRYVLVEWLLGEGISYWLVGRVFFTIPIGPSPCKVGIST